MVLAMKLMTVGQNIDDKICVGLKNPKRGNDMVSKWNHFSNINLLHRENVFVNTMLDGKLLISTQLWAYFELPNMKFER